MVSFKTLVVAALAATIADAAIAPSYPQPGTVQVVGQSYDITWSMRNDECILFFLPFFLSF